MNDTATTAIAAGDDVAFAELAARYRRELQAHCYRMLGSFEDSEDPQQRLEWPRGSDASDEERALLQRYLAAIEHADADAFVEMLCENARFGMSRSR